MTRITFARHAESVLNAQPELVVGRSNYAPLTTRGTYQASLLGAYFRENGHRFDEIISSGAERTNRTARIAIEAAGFDQNFLVDERLQEVSQGPWEGMHRDQVYNEEVIRRHQLDDLDGSLPGAESIADAQQRGMEALEDIRSTYTGNVLVVGHGLLIRSIVGAIYGQTKLQILESRTPNVSLTDIHARGNTYMVGAVGKTVISE